MEEKKYLKPKEIADYFGVTLATVRRWVKAGKLKAIETPGGHSRIIASNFYKMVKDEETAMEKMTA